jgi:hypothetical protein
MSLIIRLLIGSEPGSQDLPERVFSAFADRLARKLAPGRAARIRDPLA